MTFIIDYNQIAKIYHNLGVGSVENRNYIEAFVYFNKSASLGFINSIINLGYLYLNGYGTDINYQKALQLYKIAADEGSKIAEDTVELIKKKINTSPTFDNSIEVSVLGDVKEGDLLAPSGNNDGKLKKKQINDFVIGKAISDKYEKNGNFFTKIIVRNW